ncbi:phosphatase PAP2 family protein [Rhizobium calliandrae]|uniref:Phosphatase PAP2 family protein n=1 Tax=Rhizobium calliandrae TaxID=1312182 RepID=A0ABT7KPK0_9HYPH|nr:phosphatase PAP2 family protein [Rhizobium calliandrae]MDL2409189.1 phosphatase PAP2 family protein [Rhizobium calliandrae]
MYDFDVAATQWINAWSGHSTLSDAAMIWVSAVGVPLMILGVAGQWWLRADKRHTRHVLVASGMAFLLGLAINQIVLLFVHRMRPYDNGLTHLLVSKSADFSFPSDHATASFAIASTFLLYGMRRGYIFLAAAVIVALSRIYVGTHYLSDVVGGAVTALIAVIAVRAIYREDTRIDRFITGIL